MATGHGPNRRLGLIWPRDPLPGNPAKWPRGKRLKDVLTGKGPDVFFGDIDSHMLRPRMSRWSRWWDVHGQPDDQDHLTLPSFPGADRGNKRYDFRTRKYKMPDNWTWSKVTYPNINEQNWRLPHNWQVPLFFWDRNGIRHP